MAYRGIIMELEGTAVDTSCQHYKAWAVIANRIGAPFSPPVHQRIQSLGGMDALEVLLEGYSGRPFSYEEKDGLAEEQNAIYQKMLSLLTPADLICDAATALEHLKILGLPLAACQFGHGLLWGPKNLGLGGAFDVTLAGEPALAGKTFLRAAEMLKLPVTACLVAVGNCASVAAAQSAGFATAGVGDAALCGHPGHPLLSLEELPHLVEFPAGSSQS